MWVRIPVPKLSGALVSNLLGLAGAAGLVAAVGGLTRNVWWSVLLASLILVGVAYVTLLAAERAAQPAHAGEVKPVMVTVQAPAGMDPAELQRAIQQALRRESKMLRPA